MTLHVCGRVPTAWAGRNSITFPKHKLQISIPIFYGSVIGPCLKKIVFIFPTFFLIKSALIAIKSTFFFDAHDKKLVFQGPGKHWSISKSRTNPLCGYECPPPYITEECNSFLPTPHKANAMLNNKEPLQQIRQNEFFIILLWWKCLSTPYKPAAL